MQGPIENALMLTAAGNAFLAGRDIAGFWPDAPTFKFLKLCEFRLPPPSGNERMSIRLWPPIRWNGSRRQKANCRGYRLHSTQRQRGPNQQIDTPDRMLAALRRRRSALPDRGGRRTQLGALGRLPSPWRSQRSRSQDLALHAYPAGHGSGEGDRTGPAAVSARKSAYVRCPQSKPTRASRNTTRSRTALPAPAPRWKARRRDEWPHVREIVRYTGFDDRQLNVLHAINHAWVFGGMGSWNDLGGGPTLRRSVGEALQRAQRLHRGARQFDLPRLSAAQTQARHAPARGSPARRRRHG